MRRRLFLLALRLVVGRDRSRGEQYCEHVEQISDVHGRTLAKRVRKRQAALRSLATVRRAIRRGLPPSVL
jgi:hypothetical protein